VTTGDPAWTGMAQTGWWDVTVPEYLIEARRRYVEQRGS